MNTQFFIKEVTSSSGDVVTQIFMKTEDGSLWSVPQNKNNSDHQRFLLWCEMGNTPDELILPEEEVIEDGN